VSDLIPISIKIDVELLKQLDVFAVNQRKSRSEVVREAIRFYLMHYGIQFTREV